VADSALESVISVVLLPNAEDSRALTACSNVINGVAPSAVVLSGQCLPHITVAQFFAPTDKMGDLWQEVQQYKDTVSELTSIGLAFVPGRSRDETWAALDFMKSRAIATLQEAVLATRFARNHPMNNGSGDQYWPHVTLALFGGRQAVGLPLTPFPIFRRQFGGLRLAVGVNGPNLTLATVVAPEGEE